MLNGTCGRAAKTVKDLCKHRRNRRMDRGDVRISIGVRNVLSEKKKQQVIALGKLRWPLQRCRATHRCPSRETDDLLLLFLKKPNTVNDLCVFYTHFTREFQKRGIPQCVIGH